jgi:phage tail sheath gpL-like
MPPALADQWTGPERNMLDYDGVANFSVNDSGQVTVARQITTYINNAQDVPDTTFLDVDDVIRAAYLRYSLRVYAGRQWPRYTIADDDTQLTVGVAVTTPSLMKASFANLVKQWEAAGLITDAATTIANMVVQRNQTDATRADILMPVTPVKGLHVQAAQIQLQQ